jgi:hypothetical protein
MNLFKLMILYVIQFKFVGKKIFIFYINELSLKIFGLFYIRKNSG